MKRIHPASLPPFALEMVANRFKVLGEVSRLKILIALEEGEKNVTTLIGATGLSQANLSRHLQTLADAGILARRKEGMAVFYSIADPSIFKLCDLVCGGLAKRIDTHAAAFRGGR